MASLTSQNVSLNNLHDKLNNNIKNKLYNINKQDMDYSTCSTCADASELEADNLDNVGLIFYKNMDYKQKKLIILMFMLSKISINVILIPYIMAGY